MSYRSKTSRKVDKQVFKHTADKTKKINILPKVSRGGIRL